MPQPIPVKADILNPQEYEAAAVTLGKTKEQVSVLLLVAYYVGDLLNKTVLSFASAEEIYSELLPMLLGVPTEDNNQAIIARRLHSIVLSKSRETGKVYLLIELNTSIGSYRIGPELLGCPDLWTNEPESATAISRDMLVFYPLEYPCVHDKRVTSASCKPGHVHRSIFHLGADAGKKYDAFDQALEALHKDDEEPEEAQDTQLPS
jgi:hypothetical protein